MHFESSKITQVLILNPCDMMALRAANRHRPDPINRLNFFFGSQNTRQEEPSNGKVTVFLTRLADFRDNSGIKHGNRGHSKSLEKGKGKGELCIWH